MTELKTLKDMMGIADLPYPKEACLRKELRQEAIKWIKELTSADHNTITNGLAITEKGFKSYDPEPIIFWIKHFFNLTEDG